MNLRLLVIFFATVTLSLQAHAEKGCLGWQIIEETSDYAIIQHECTCNSSSCPVQTVQITKKIDRGMINNGTINIGSINICTIYFLVAGPYGWDQFLLNGSVPSNFPTKYLNKCCWLRRTKNKGNYVITYSPHFNPEELLLQNS